MLPPVENLWSIVVTNLRHVDCEDVSSVRADVDVAPQPHVVVLPLDSVEPELAEMAELETGIVITYRHKITSLLHLHKGTNTL